jgi:O-antigen/teichoic acid export membrane protein
MVGSIERFRLVCCSNESIRLPAHEFAADGRSIRTGSDRDAVMTDELPGARPALDGSPPEGWSGHDATTITSSSTPSSRSMDQALIHGFAWTAGARWASQLLSWAVTLVVAKVLDPADYGVVGMSVLVLSLVAMIDGFGVTTAIVTLRDLTEDDLRRLNAFAVLFGIVCFLFGAALAIPLGAYFRSPAVPLIVVVQSTGFVLSSFQSVPSACLQRELRFKKLASIDIVRSFVASLAALALALAGARYWTLVVAELLAATTATILLVGLRPTSFLWRDFGKVRRAVVFGARTIVDRISWYVYSNADFAVAGRLLGPAALGSYSFAWTLVSLPIEKVTSLIGRVTPSFLAAYRSDPPALRRYVLGITEGLALLTLPATAGIALVAGDIIPLVFGTKWQSAIVPLQVLAACMALRSIVPVINNALTAVRDVRFMMWRGIVSAVGFPVCFWIGARIAGINGIAVVWLIAYPISVVPVFWRAVHLRIFDVAGYVAALAPAVVCSAAMSVAVLGLRELLISGATTTVAVRCALEVIVGVVVYVIILFLGYRSRVRATIALIRPTSVAA